MHAEHELAYLLCSAFVVDQRAFAAHPDGMARRWFDLRAARLAEGPVSPHGGRVDTLFDATAYG